jgi:hypothetical protein
VTPAVSARRIRTHFTFELMGMEQFAQDGSILPTAEAPRAGALTAASDDTEASKPPPGSCPLPKGNAVVRLAAAGTVAARPQR